MKFLLLLLLSILPLIVVPENARAQTPTISQAQAQSVLTVLQNPQQRDNFIKTLQAIATAQQATMPKGPAQLAPNSLGATLIERSTALTRSFGTEMRNTAHRMADLPLLWTWITRLASNPAARNHALIMLGKVAVILAIGTLLDWVARKILCRLQNRLAKAVVGKEADEPLAPESAAADPASQHNVRLGNAWRLLKRLPLLLLRMALDLIPIGVFFLSTQIVLGSNIGAPLPDALITVCADAYIVFRLILSLNHTLLLPEQIRLRLLRLDDEDARSLRRWVALIAGVIVFGVAGAQVALLLGLYPSARDDVLKLVMLVAHLLLVCLVLQFREPVARHIHPRRTLRGPLATMLQWLAATWHWIAIFYIVALWFVWAVEVRDGVTRLMHFFFSTVSVLIVARLVSIAILGGLYRVLHVPAEMDAKYPGLQGRVERYTPFVRLFVNVILSFFTLIALLEVWGLGVLGWFGHGGVGSQLVSAFSSIGICLILAAFMWEGSNAAMDWRMERLTTNMQIGRSIRLRTLRPILRTTLLVFIVIVTGMTILSEIGVNIAPLLAGAGIIGVAVGFGSQKLVQDLITGLFLLLENAVQVGDSVTVAGLSGTVEYLSIRTIRLRAGDGSVHIIPFSSVTSVTNVNRGVGNASVVVTVDAQEDVGRVADMLKDLAAEMHRDKDFAPFMIGELDLWGVDKVDGASVTLAGQIVCTDSGRWPVQREYNKRLHAKCRELGIVLSVPTQMMIVQQISGPTTAPEAGKSEKTDHDGSISD